ncbi:MAG: hypothetical protein ACKOGJ_10670, partial [Phycisphaerales bacterium]
MTSARLIAGIPSANRSLYHAVRFNVGDPAACIDFLHDGRPPHRVFVCRDIEMERARRHARTDAVACPRDFEPAGGLSGDRLRVQAVLTPKAGLRIVEGEVPEEVTVEAGCYLVQPPAVGAMRAMSAQSSIVRAISSARCAWRSASN